MNCKGGIFAIIIGGMAVALFGLAVFSTQAMLFEEQSDDYIAVMSDVRMVWQNTMLVFDSAVKDAADDIGCGVTQANIESYLNNAINSINNSLTPGVQCNYSTANFSVAANTVTYEANISCERGLIKDGKTDFSASYSRNVIFVKTCP